MVYVLMMNGKAVSCSLNLSDFDELLEIHREIDSITLEVVSLPLPSCAQSALAPMAG